MASIFVNIEKGVEVAAEDLLKFITKANTGLAKDSVAAVPALGVLLGAIGTALNDTATGAANPMTLLITLPQDASDFKAVWSDIVALAATLGIKL